MQMLTRLNECTIFRVNNCHRNIIQLVTSFHIRISLIWISKSMSLVLFPFKFQSCLQMNLLFIFKLAAVFYCFGCWMSITLLTTTTARIGSAYSFVLTEFGFVFHVFSENPEDQWSDISFMLTHYATMMLLLCVIDCSVLKNEKF